jgi:hypothetical protein
VAWLHIVQAEIGWDLAENITDSVSEGPGLWDSGALGLTQQ